MAEQKKKTIFLSHTHGVEGGEEGGGSQRPEKKRRESEGVRRRKEGLEIHATLSHNAVLVTTEDHIGRRTTGHHPLDGKKQMQTPLRFAPRWVTLCGKQGDDSARQKKKARSLLS
jgi:hypothetical protein